MLTTPAYSEQHLNPTARAALTLGDDEFNFVATLAYTLVPSLSREDVHSLLPWLLARWASSSGAQETCSSSSSGGSTRGSFEAAVEVLAADEAVCEALSQVEYFIVGTDNGQVFVLPMVPTHFLQCVASKYAERFPALVARLKSEESALNEAGRRVTDTAVVPSNCGLKRLLHRHVAEEPVIALDHCGTLVASAASADTTVAISVFHPRASPIILLPHEKRVRSLKLWEGSVFVDREGGGGAGAGDGGEECALALRRCWRTTLEAQEPAAVYLFTGEELDAVVRLFRVDVLHGTFSLMHVFVVSPNLTGLAHPLAVLEREDTSKAAVQREVDRSIHCLAIDDNARLLAGMEGGICVWALGSLPFTVPTAAPPTTNRPGAACAQVDGENPHRRAEVDPLNHALCWDADTQCPMTGALLSSPGFMAVLPDEAVPTGVAEDAVAAATRCVRRRALRLVNHHVWVRDSKFLQQQLSEVPPAHVTVRKERSRWKPKYGRTVAGGVAVGVVSNEVAVPVESAAGDDSGVTVTLEEVLANTVVTVSFEGGEVRNDVNLPLACVQPVVYPLCWLRMAGTACFALQVLQSSGRIVSSGSDGRVAVWFWRQGAQAAEDGDAARDKEDVYVPYLVAGTPHPGHRGIGRHVCVMRSPDVFLSCGYDDGVVREWHVYDEPERLLRCERRFTMLPSATGALGNDKDGKQFKELADAMLGKTAAQKAHEKAPKDTATDGEAASKHSCSSSSSSASEEEEDSEGDGTNAFDGVAGISGAVGFPMFGAVFLVGVFESTIQTFSLSEVQGCEAPPDYIYNGFKTVKMSHSPPSAAA